MYEMQGPRATKPRGELIAQLPSISWPTTATDCPSAVPVTRFYGRPLEFPPKGWPPSWW